MVSSSTTSTLPVLTHRIELTPEEMIIENYLQVEQFYYTITEQLFKTFYVIFFVHYILFLIKYRVNL